MPVWHYYRKYITWAVSTAVSWLTICGLGSAGAPPVESSSASGKTTLQESALSTPTIGLDHSYRRAWQLVKDNTMFPERLLNWDLWEHKFEGKLRKESDLEDAINQMLGQLSDQYSYFRTADQTQQRCLTDEERGVVEHFKLADGVGYLQVKTFCSHHVAEEIEAALFDMSDCQHLVVDLRENRGGYVEQALLAFSLFVDHGKFVSIQGRQDGQDYFEHVFVTERSVLRMVNGKITREVRLPNLTGKKDLIVMVNDGTRSAAEMLAGALREQRDAKLIGERTFGKGVVQGTWFLESGGSIKIAMARFYLPDGECINGQGLVPDVRAEFPDDNTIKRVPEKLHMALIKKDLRLSGGFAQTASEH